MTNLLDKLTPFAIAFFAALALTIVLTPIVREVNRRLGMVDKPDPRRINKVPIPRGGGVALFLGLFGSFIVYVFATGSRWVGSGVGTHPVRVTALAGILFLIGLADDKWSLPPKLKLLGQIAVAFATWFWGGLGFSTLWPALPPAVDCILTVFWIVGAVNAFNLIDGLDGLASGLACIASFTMFILSVMSGRTDAAALAIALSGATLGFLRYNFNPASIFLGDSGSLLLGYTLGIASMLSVTRVAGLTTIIVPLVIAGIPIIDTFSAIVRRKRAHVSIGQADRGHIHHRLIAEGFNQRQAVLIMYAWTALLCLGTFLMTQVSVMPRIAIFAALLIVSALIAGKLHLFRPVLLHHTDPETGDDELVSPQDPEFVEEEEKFEERQAKRLHRRH